MPLEKVIRIATRESELALAQARFVAALLEHRGQNTQLVGITTEGDRRLDKELKDFGGKGVFTKEIDQAVLDRRADISVHSLKDMPVEEEEGLILAAVPTRDSDRDILLLNTIKHKDTVDNWGHAHGRNVKNELKGKLEEFINPLTVIGCGSPRRIAQLLPFTQKLEPVRGNIQTRLRKMQENNWCGLVMAEAAYNRLHLNIEHSFIPLDIFPAAGQGALGIRCRDNATELSELLKGIEDYDSRCRVDAERSFLRHFGGGCHVPAGIRSVVNGDSLHLEGAIFSADGTDKRFAFVSGFCADAEELGRSLAMKLAEEK